MAAKTLGISAVSRPKIMDPKTDRVTAIVTRINGVLRNRQAMLRRGAVIIAWMLVSLATGLLGLVFVYPLRVYATWHAYRAP